MDRSAAEQVVSRDLDATTGLGKPISSRARMSQRTVESYLKAGVKPRWMERISEIDNPVVREQPSKFSVAVTKPASKAHRGE